MRAPHCAVYCARSRGQQDRNLHCVLSKPSTGIRCLGEVWKCVSEQQGRPLLSNKAMGMATPALPRDTRAGGQEASQAPLWDYIRPKPWGLVHQLQGTGHRAHSPDHTSEQGFVCSPHASRRRRGFFSREEQAVVQ